MKRIACSLLLMMVALFGCMNEDPVLAPEDDAEPSIGKRHNEVLTRIYAELDGREMWKGAQDLVIARVVNEVAADCGLDPIPLAEVREHRNRGRKLMRLDPTEIMASVLSPAEMAWWCRFAEEAEPATVREVFRKHCAEYGRPEAGSTLDSVTDIAVHSAEFWYDRFQDGRSCGDMAKCLDPQTRWLRFLAIVAVDAVCGGIASGTGGPVGGAIVGALASEGANSLM